MDPSKIGGFFSDKGPLNPLNKTDKAKNIDKKKDDKTDTSNITAHDEGSELSGLFKMPAPKVVSKLQALLEKSLSDPKVEKLIIEYKIPANSRQALAFCAYTCVKQILGKKLNLSQDDEKALIEAIQKEYEEDASKPLDPDEHKKRKRERRKKSKPIVNAVMSLLQESLRKLEKDKGSGFSIQL